MFIIDTDVTINGNIQFGANSGLIFQGGMIRATTGTVCKLTGNSTTVEAPIDQIFGDNIDIDGTWRVDKTFPQWFGAITYSDEDSVPNSASPSTSAINKAIQMAGCGITFLPIGVYVIDGALKLPQGGSLIGASTGTPVSNHINSATLYPSPNFTAINETTALLEININRTQNSSSPTIEVVYPNPTATVYNVRFSNKKLNNPNIPVAILVAGGVHIDKVIFRNFPTAVKYFDINAYYDQKSITNCTYSNWRELVASQFDNIPYAFDLIGLGDALIFQHNAVSGIEYNKNATDSGNLRTIRNRGLRIAHCSGGLISDNVINGDVLIQSSKAFTYSNNHMEYGAQLNVFASEIEITSNWLEIGPNPVLILKGNKYGSSTIATLINNCFVARDLKNVHSDRPTITDADKLRVKSLSNYDMILSKNTELRIMNSFRYWNHTPGIADVCPVGLAIQSTSLEFNDTGTEVLTDFTQFNSKSCWLSFQSLIIKRNITNFNWKIDKLDITSNTPAPSNSETNPWLGESGSYSYQVQIVWDKDRSILGNITTHGVSKSLGSYTYAGLQSDGMRIIFNNDAICTLRVIRTKSGTSGYEYCDIPMCGTTILYDNGVMIGGKTWQKSTSSPILSQSTANLQKLQFIGENVECMSTATSAPTMGSGWIAGDRIFNIGSNSSWSFVIKK